VFVCLGVHRKSSPTSIAEVWTKNLSDKPVIFDVVIEDVTHNEVVFWETHPTGPMADRDDDGNEEIDTYSWKIPFGHSGTMRSTLALRRMSRLVRRR
jgi:hypothetical protein